MSTPTTPGAGGVQGVGGADGRDVATGRDVADGRVVVEIDGPVATVLLDRPAKLNALTMVMLDDLEAGLARLDADPGVRVVVLASAGDRVFCAGADIKHFMRLGATDMWRTWTRRGHQVFDRLASLRQPTIAAVDGNAYGGGLELALACDLRVLADDATVGLTEVGLGTVPGWGGTSRLRDLVGPARAKEMILTGRPMDAARCHDWGIATALAPRAAVADAAGSRGGDRATSPGRRADGQAGRRRRDRVAGDDASRVSQVPPAAAPPTSPRASPPSSSAATRRSTAGERSGPVDGGRPSGRVEAAGRPSGRADGGRTIDAEQVRRARREAAGAFPLAELTAEARRLLDFGRAARLPTGGFGWLDPTGHPTPGMPAYLYVTGRMTHTYSLAHLLGVPGAAELVDHGLRSLRTVFRDAEHGGWFTAVGPDGVVDDRKWSYPHAFVVLAASSALVAGRPGAELLDEALAVVEERFWDDELGVVVEEWDAAFTRLSGYRGANANMHTVEAFLAAYDATGRRVWLDRARRISERVAGVAAEHAWRLPEHYDARFRPLLDHNADHLDDPFKPFGATVGHGFEWSRLLLHLSAALAGSGASVGLGAPESRGSADPWSADSSSVWGSPAGTGEQARGGTGKPASADTALASDPAAAARALFDRAVTDGWAVDGAEGFVYTTDWAGEPVIRQRLHWVVCEALGAAAVLWRATGEDAFAQRYRQWWDYAGRSFVDIVGGSWHHELDPDNRPAATIRPGKADIYHATQAMLLPGLPLRASVAGALAAQG